MTIHKKLFIIPLLLIVIPLILIGTVIFYSAKNYFESEVMAKLTAINDLKVERVQSFFSERQSDIIHAQNLEVIKESLPVLNASANNINSSPYVKDKALLDRQLVIFQKAYQYSDIMLVSPENKIVYVFNEARMKQELGQPLPDIYGESFEKAKTGIYLSNIAKTKDKEYKFGMLMTAPITNAAGNFAGLVAFELNMDSLLTLIKDNSGLGQTGETVMAKKEFTYTTDKSTGHSMTRKGNYVLFLHPLNKDMDAAFSEFISYGNDLALSFAKRVQGEKGAGVSIDYRGNKVLSAWRYVPSLGWGLVTKIDAAEAFEPIYRLRGFMFLVLIVTILLDILIAFLAAQSISSPIKELYKGIEVIGSGNLDYKVGTNAKDEIGGLSRAFDQMTKDLKRTTTSISKLNLEIVERRKAEHEMRRAKEYTELIFRLAPSAIFTMDKNSKITSWNNKAAELTGYTAEEVIGKDPYQLGIFKYCEERASAVGSIEEELLVRECTIKRKDGQERIILKNTDFLRDEDGNVTGAIEAFEDITARKELDKLKDEFISTVSHELRTPISIFKEGVSLVLDREAGDINEKQEKLLSNARANIDRLSELIDELLDVAKIEAGRMEIAVEVTPINVLVKDVASSFELQAKNKGLELKADLPEKPINIYIDPDKILRVFNNLISNAIKFTEKGQILVSIKDNDSEIECTVSDTGKGILKNDLLKIFNKFQQLGRSSKLSAKGTGLGLSICKGIIELHNGRIWAESEFGEGSKFKFTIPKYTPKEIFSNYVKRALKVAVEENACLSVESFSIKDYDTLLQEMGENKIVSIMHNVETIIKTNLRRNGDIAINDTKAILVMLPFTKKSDALLVLDRFTKLLDEYLSKEKLDTQVELVYKEASFPKDGATDEDLLKEIS